MDIIRVLRVIEYVGPRDLVETQVNRSIHGIRTFGNSCLIKVSTIGTYPEVLSQDALNKELVDANYNANARIQELTEQVKSLTTHVQTHADANLRLEMEKMTLQDEIKKLKESQE